MSITIPTWALWTLAIVIGVPALLAIIAFAVFGFVAAKALGGGVYK